MSVQIRPRVTIVLKQKPRAAADSAPPLVSREQFGVESIRLVCQGFSELCGPGGVTR